jgi:diguanylate cyclase (GGDEF)-like protein
MREAYLKKSALVLILSVVALFYAADLVANITPAASWRVALLPAGQLMSAAILFFAYFRARKRIPAAISWLFLGLGCSLWGGSDIAYILYSFGPAQTWGQTAMSWLNMLANLCFVAAGGVFFLEQLKGWNRARLALDVMMLTLALAVVIWVAFLNRDMQSLGILMQNGAVSAVSISSKLLMGMVLTIWLLSVKSGRVPVYIIVSSLGLLLFVITSLAYYYVRFYGNGLSMRVQMIALGVSVMLMGIGGLIKLLTKKDDLNSTINMFGKGKQVLKHVKELAMLLVPVAAMALKGFVLLELAHYLAALVVYKLLSAYFEVSAKKDRLLLKQKQLNNELEAIVAERTQTLVTVNEDLSQKNEQLGYLSTRDMLTSLYNRRYLLSWLEQKIAAAEPGGSITLMYIDLDRFKVINDTYGHDMGDQVLVETAKRLSEMKNGQSILARMGGDEFVLAYSGEGRYRSASETASRIIKHCNQDIHIGDYVFSPALCIGISTWPLDAADVGALLKNADIALYVAKERGINKFASFSLMMQQRTQRRNEVEMMLRQTEITSEFTLHYQPQFSLPDNKLIGVEALIRWNSPLLGMVTPTEFIPIAEETGRINEIGLWVLRQAAEKAADWNTRFGGGLVVGVNISPKQLNNASLAFELKQMVERDDFDPAWLDIEITESVALEGEYRLSQIFSLFKSIGMSVSIDDFGTGYSSIMALKHYPFDRLKIAKPLVDSVTLGKRNEQIVKSIILLAKSIGMQTIAEGVETQEQYLKLAEIGCGQVQGYLTGRPVPAQDFETLYLTNKAAYGARM